MKVRVASAGTGKTTSLVLRYLELIASGTPLRRIAGVTFTRAAAEELRQRVGQGIQQVQGTGGYLDFERNNTPETHFREAALELEGATLSTIHGFMIEALRLVAPQMGLDPNFSVLGEWEAEALFEEEVKTLRYLAASPEHGLYPSLQELDEASEQHLIRLFKQRSLAENFTAGSNAQDQALLRFFENAYRRFQVRLGASLLSPAEVERRALQMVRLKAASARLASRFHVLLVDEFQDINPLQGQFFDLLEAAGIAIEVVGDPKQSIYAFRHADVTVFRRALAKGERLPDLANSRRHSRVIARFLNHMTTTFAQLGLGFKTTEAPMVSPAGTQAEKLGRVELHWITGTASMASLREHEARLLAQRLKAIASDHPLKDIAVLARSNNHLKVVEQALLAEGLDYVLVQGRGYYERLEIRDLYHALSVGVDAAGLSLAAWLRSPFAGLGMQAIDGIFTSETPLVNLEQNFPEVYKRLEQIQAQVRMTPIEALKFLIREPFIGGKRYVDFLSQRARENVDALLFTVASQATGDLELLLDRLDHLSRQPDAGEVPQSGEGISLLTVHRAKGLEWPVVAVFNLGGRPPVHTDPLAVDPDNGMIRLSHSEGFKAIEQKLKQRQEQEAYRLLYVAASRARDVLIMTGSVKNNHAEGWAKHLEQMQLGAGSKGYQRDDFVLQTWPFQQQHFKPLGAHRGKILQAAPWIDKWYPRHSFPPVFSPSGLKTDSHEPLPLPDASEGEILPGKARSVGTLVHYAISQNWQADRADHLENLKAQEVMFPFSEEEKHEIMQDVSLLLMNYQQLLGSVLPCLTCRDEDYAELPMALPLGTTVWQGIIDRLYRVDEQWILEDYKTDRTVQPELYDFQLAIYQQAILEVRQVRAKVQLVFLRHQEIIEVSESSLRTALKRGLKR